MFNELFDFILARNTNDRYVLKKNNDRQNTVPWGRIEGNDFFRFNFEFTSDTKITIN